MIAPTVFGVGAYANRAFVVRGHSSELVELTAIVRGEFSCVSPFGLFAVVDVN